MRSPRRKETDRQHSDAAEHNGNETPRWDLSPGQQPADNPCATGKPGDDPLGRVVDVHVGPDEVGGHHDASQSPEGDRGDPERRTMQLQRDIRGSHAGEYNASSRAFHRGVRARLPWGAGCSGPSWMSPRWPTGRSASEGHRVITLPGFCASIAASAGSRLPVAVNTISRWFRSKAGGPEGGWTDGELAELRERGGLAVNLGPRILRARLAPIVAAAILVQQR